jgi:hypothetical protein
MIISASYKTDIPTFYGKWFMNRLDEGFCHMINPYNQRAHRIDLSRESVDAFVFWTKNIGPFRKDLEEVNRRGYSFMLQHTINGYPRSLETSVVNAERSIEYVKTISDRYGPRVPVWRYDPVVFTSETCLDFHRKKFDFIANSLRTYTDEVVVSFAQVYRKTQSNMDRAARDQKFDWEDPDDEIKMNLAIEFSQMAKAQGMQLTICSQDQYLSPGIVATKCVDADRISDITGRFIKAKVKGNRADCGCYESRDIGEYDTCPHGCVYCYAVRRPDIAKVRYKKHNPKSSFLFEPTRKIVMADESEKQGSKNKSLQIPLIPQ